MKKEFKATRTGYHIIVTFPDKASNIMVQGYAVDENYVPINGTRKVRRKAKFIEEVEIKISIVRNIVDRELDQLLRSKADRTKKASNVETIISDTFNMVLDMGADFMPWGERYSNILLTYSKRNIVPWLEEHIGPDGFFTKVERDDLQNSIAEDVRADRRFIGKPEDALANAARYLNAFDQIYILMRDLNSELKDWSFTVTSSKILPRREQEKMMPTKCHLKFRRLVEERIEKEPKYARGAALMDNDLRAGEAAAVNKHYIEDNGEFMIVSVVWQEYKGKRVAVLKTKGSYRTIVLDEWATSVVRKCNKLIKDEDVDSEEAPLIGSKLSAWVRDLIYKSGVTEEYIKDAFKAASKHLECRSDGKMYPDAPAHILRRHRASIMCNICGYTSAERDLYLGHKRKTNKYLINNPQWDTTQKRIAIKNSLYDLNPEVSNNPLYSPINLRVGDEGELYPFRTYRFINRGDTSIVLNIDIITEEPGQEISIDSPQEAIFHLKMRSEKMQGKRRNENLIGGIEDEE